MQARSRRSPWTWTPSWTAGRARRRRARRMASRRCPMAMHSCHPRVRRRLQATRRQGPPPCAEPPSRLHGQVCWPLRRTCVTIAALRCQLGGAESQSPKEALLLGKLNAGNMIPCPSLQDLRAPRPNWPQQSSNLLSSPNLSLLDGTLLPAHLHPTCAGSASASVPAADRGPAQQ